LYNEHQLKLPVPVARCRNPRPIAPSGRGSETPTDPRPKGAVPGYVIAALAFSAVPLLAQIEPPATPTEMPPGLFRGAVVAWSGTAASGDLTIHAGQSATLFCQFDSHSYMERDHRRISVASLNPGERVEILADHKPGFNTCYARTVAVIDPAAERAAERARQTRTQPVARTSFFTPAGDRTFAGMVIRVTSRALTLRTRAGETTLTLRPDTRYLDDGVRLDAAALHVNTHVFVRAGKTIEGVLEAYQVMWGKILPSPIIGTR
jgi:hypothetical protein